MWIIDQVVPHLSPSCPDGHLLFRQNRPQPDIFGHLQPASRKLCHFCYFQCYLKNLCDRSGKLKWRNKIQQKTATFRLIFVKIEYQHFAQTSQGGEDQDQINSPWKNIKWKPNEDFLRNEVLIRIECAIRWNEKMKFRNLRLYLAAFAVYALIRFIKVWNLLDPIGFFILLVSNHCSRYGVMKRRNGSPTWRCTRRKLFTLPQQIWWSLLKYGQSHHTYSYIHAGVLSARISQGSRGWREECVGEKKEKGKAESLEKKNQLSEEKLWQLGGVGPRSSNEEGENLKQETQKVQQFAELGLWGKSKLIKQNQILSFWNETMCKIGVTRRWSLSCF